MSWGMTPAAFWELDPTEWWWIAGARRPQKMHGSTPESELAELHEDMKTWRS